MFVLRELVSVLAALLAAVKINNENQHKLMTALQNLQNSVAALTNAVDTAIPLIKPATGGATDAELAAVQTAVDAQTARITTAVAAATPTPAP